MDPVPSASRSVRRLRTRKLEDGTIGWLAEDLRDSGDARLANMVVNETGIRRSCINALVAASVTEILIYLEKLSRVIEKISKRIALLEKKLGAPSFLDKILSC